MMTRTQIKDFTRAKLSELDSQKIVDGVLNQDINLAQREVQSDLKTLGIMQFTKKAFLAGSVVAVPSDMLSDPNALIDAKASDTGVRASVTISYANPTANLTLTSREPGVSTIHYGVNGGTDPTAGTIAVTCTFGTYWTIEVEFVSDDLTCTQICALLNADPVFSSLMIASTTTGSIKPKPSVGSAGTLSGGSGATFYPCKKLTIEEYNRVASNSYLAPSTTNPAICKMGDTSASQYLYFLPSTVTFATINYRYLVADLSAETSTLGLPAEFEDLVLKKLIEKCYISLKMIAESQAQAVEYQKKIQDLNGQYQNSLQAIVQEKTRLQSNDANN